MTLDIVQPKTCSKCGETKPLVEYNKMSNSRDGHRPNCKVCHSAACKDYLARNPEKNKNYRRLHKDRLRPMWFEWSSQQKASDPLWTRLRGGAARAKEQGLTVEKFTGADLRAYWKDNGVDATKCFYTGEPLGDNWELDHAHPLSRPGCPGHVISNLVPASKWSNRSKRNKTPEEYFTFEREKTAN